MFDMQLNFDQDGYVTAAVGRKGATVKRDLYAAAYGASPAYGVRQARRLNTVRTLEALGVPHGVMLDANNEIARVVVSTGDWLEHGLWITGEGKVMYAREMQDQHLENAINMLIREKPKMWAVRLYPLVIESERRREEREAKMPVYTVTVERRDPATGSMQVQSATVRGDFPGTVAGAVHHIYKDMKQEREE